MARARVGSTSDVPVGQGRVVDVGGKAIALFNVGGTYYATDNECPHRGGPLGEGDLNGPVVICPWHGWRWDVTNGANSNNPAITVACFPVIVDRGEIFVELP
jgi:3-phenylpropionate/trans-cinnamate dioxygenase ferredoxin component